MEKHYGIGHIKRLKDRFNKNMAAKPEVLELMLSYAIKGKDVKPQSKEIYSKAGNNFKKIFEVIANQKIDGVGEETKTFFKIVKSFIQFHSEETFVNKKFAASSQADIIIYFKNICADMTREAVYCIYLDAKNKISGNSMICEGTITQSLLYPRELISEAMKRGALSIVILHNHPSGDPTPSENDKKITRKLLFATKEMDIILLDHIIIGTQGKGYFSFYEDGLMEKYNAAYKNVLEAAQL
ncbi:MAG: DNA repair protein RadC [bacterium]